MFLEPSPVPFRVRAGTVSRSRLRRRGSLVLASLLLFLTQPWPGNSQEDASGRFRGGVRRTKLHVDATTTPGFTLMPPEKTGIAWTNRLSGARLLKHQNLINGAGVAAGDFDGDGLCDLYFCNKEGANALYRNRGGWIFTDVTARAGVACAEQSSTGAVFADLDGDGALDILVSSFDGPNACFRNLGGGDFTNVTVQAGLSSRGGATSMALADVDGDGDLDLYVCYFGKESVLRDGLPYSIQTVNNEPVVVGRYAKRLKVINKRVVELGEPDLLYLNDGHGHFAPVRWEDRFRDEANRPMSVPLDFGLAVQMRDINGDGFPDIYVCNDFESPDRLWLNDGTGHFRAIQPLALRAMSFNSMGVDFADLDRDGYLDFFVVDMLSRDHHRRMVQTRSMGWLDRTIGEIDNRENVTRNTLFRNRGDGTYAEMAEFSGLAASEWSWCPVFLDVDLDGYEDVLITNGTAPELADRDRRTKPHPGLVRWDTANNAFWNHGGFRFEEVGARWGFNATNVCHGIALADLDNDGDLDVIVNCLNSPPLLYRNNCPAPRIAVRLKGQPPNTHGIGASIVVRGGPVVQSQEILSGGRYLSSDEPMRVFAAGKGTNFTIDIRWVSGRTSHLSDALANYLYEFEEPPGPARAPASSPNPTSPSPFFEDLSDRLAHFHHEEPFDDFRRQPLLPKRLSQLGPGVAWFDLNADGHDDLILGSGKGGRLTVFYGDGKGGFSPAAASVISQVADRDQTSVLGWEVSPARRELLVGNANYEDGSPLGEAARHYLFETGVNPKALPGIPVDRSSVGPMALADFDGDGNLDLFVGGRVIPGRYPEAASSYIFHCVGGIFHPDARNSEVLKNIGLVSGAVFADLDGDGKPELILACEWGPLRVFRDENGLLREITGPLGLAKYTGWWNSVTAGDIDGDGRIDLIAGNWGWNSTYQRPTDEEPLQLFYGDFNATGSIDLIETERDLSRNLVPRRDLNAMASALPFLRAQFTTHKAYSVASVSDLLGERISRATQVSAATLASTLFYNRGNHFEAVPLPAEAQLAPVFGVNVADMDGDGVEDIFLAQNFFAVHGETARLDAGRGLWLLNKGGGTLQPVPGAESGVKVYGEQRGSAVGDFDEDGRVDLVVSQNGAQTKLYHNKTARPGLRVRLIGSDGNPEGIGAQIRLLNPNGASPVREIHGGSGYWSQDSAVQVMRLTDQPTRIAVLWPGGRRTTNNVPVGAAEIAVRFDGSVTLMR